MKRSVITSKNGTKCRCECLKIEEFNDNSSWHVVNCRYEFKKVAKSITTEECDVETNDIVGNKTTSGNSIIKK